MGEAVSKQGENLTNKISPLSSAIAKRLQWNFLIGYLLASGNYKSYREKKNISILKYSW